MTDQVISSGKGTVSSVGTFTSASPPSPRPNPFTDSTPWGIVKIGGFTVPGIVKSIDGHEKPEEWTVQKATSSNNATTVWKGTKLAEAIKILTQFGNGPAFAKYYELRDLLRPKIGTKPPSHVIENPAINFVGVTRISNVNVGPPKFVEQGRYWTGEITVIEYNPSAPASTGPAGAAKAKADEPDPNADLKAFIDAKMQEASRL